MFSQVTSWIQPMGTVKKQPQFFHLKSTRLSQPTKPPSLKKIAEPTVSHWKTDSCPQTTTIQKEKKCGFFSVLPYVKQLRFFVESGGKFEVGDTLRVVFLAKDKQGNIATNVGDFFQASIINMKTKSGAVGIIKDHQNGTYTATFQLLWSGEVNIIVKLIHPRQAIDVIERTACEHPFDKLMFLKRYIIGAAKIDTKCNVDPAVLNSHTPVCNYSDPHAGGWWYCEKAANISCDTPGYHCRLSTHQIKLLRKDEKKLFGRGMNGVKRAIAGSPSKVNVEKGLDPLINRPRCTPGLPTPPISGFYAGGVWNSLICHNRHFSNQSEWRTCLKGKTLHFMGDSTIRQWYEQLVELLNLSESSLPDATHQTGPLLARDTTNNITIKYRAHGTPRRCNWAPVSNLQYVSNLIDRIKWGPNDVVGISVWAHFTSYPVDMYRERMEAIRAAIQRLHQRSPQTLVVIKSANTRMGDELIAGDWLAYQLDLVMREMFQGMNVVLVDAWEMTTAQQWHGDAVHPAGDIVIQELEFLCSFL
ncbi:PREDICTED: NXPE family member 3-like [Branchiostoma belcheri]|uniref:NXPE family member 3-like n=1 Tax=Branchiostoma belcheri TaxID=7741 RepID=A0A6P4ZBJ4_BRABE|nr:PREDICTED: NXPE family member 3-like [Branchiostoma belcheri]